MNKLVVEMDVSGSFGKEFTQKIIDRSILSYKNQSKNVFISILDAAINKYILSERTVNDILELKRRYKIVCRDYLFVQDLEKLDYEIVSRVDKVLTILRS